MAKTSAERQAVYRARRAGQESAERRLNTWVGSEVCSALEQLARCYGVTKRTVIELLVLNEDGRLKELKAKGGVLSDTSSAVTKSTVLPRNKLKDAALRGKKPMKSRTDKLLRNDKPELSSRNREEEVAPVIQQSSQSLGDQFGFEF